MIHPAEIERMIRAELPDARVSVVDMTGTGDHFEVEVTSKEFAGRPLVEQHRRVLSALQGEMDKRIHAVKIKTRTQE